MVQLFFLNNLLCYFKSDCWKKESSIRWYEFKKDEIVKFNKDIKTIKKKIKKVKPEYENYSTLFHSKAEVEGLYQTLSEYASLNGLIISKINKGKPTAITKASLTAKKKKKKKKKKNKKQTTKKVLLIIEYL